MLAYTVFDGQDDPLALATIRRLLLELGYVLHPESPDNLVEPLQLCMREPRSQFGGQSPLELLACGVGEDRVRDRLAELIGSKGLHRP